MNFNASIGNPLISFPLCLFHPNCTCTCSAAAIHSDDPLPFFLPIYRQTYHYDAIGRLIAQSLSFVFSFSLSHPPSFSLALFLTLPSLFNSLCLYPTLTTYACTICTCTHVHVVQLLFTVVIPLLFYVAIGKLICIFSTPFSPPPFLSLPLSLSLSPTLIVHVHVVQLLFTLMMPSLFSGTAAIATV